MPYLIPAWLIAVASIVCGAAWILFAISQKGRFLAYVLPWLSIPFFIISFQYAFFSLVPVELSTRAVYARYAIMTIDVSQAVVFIILYFYLRGGGNDTRK